LGDVLPVFVSLLPLLSFNNLVAGQWQDSSNAMERWGGTRRSLARVPTAGRDGLWRVIVCGSEFGQEVGQEVGQEGLLIMELRLATVQWASLDLYEGSYSLKVS
jgi:hypothetical protein